MNHIFITGTGKGLGKVIAEVLLEQGNIVHGISRQLNIEHVNYHHYTLDLSRPDEVVGFKFPTLITVDKIVLINNAGQVGDVHHLGNIDNQSIVDTHMVNTVAPTVLTNSFIKAYKTVVAEKMIINVSSGAATSPYDGWSAYCSSKAALEMLTKVGDQEQQIDSLPYPFRFLSIAPGVVDTGMQDQLRQSGPAGFSRLQKFLELKEKGQLYDAHDVAKEYARIIDNPSIVQGLTHRIAL